MITPPSPEPGPEVPRRLLVLEDDELLGDLLSETLHSLGYDVVEVARDGAAALEAARTRRPDLGIFDIRIPGGRDGIEIAEVVTRELDLPVVFLSGKTDDATLRRAREAGSYGYVCKPFTGRDLRSAIELALHRHRAERLIQRNEERYRRLVRQNVAAVLQETPDGTIVEANPALASLLGYPDPAALEGRPSDDFHASPGQARERREQLAQGGHVPDAEVCLVAADGRKVWVMDYATVLTDPVTGSPEVVHTMFDVTDRRERESGLEELAYHDPLTGLPNRRLLEIRARQALALAERRGSYAAVLYLDLVGFKSVNDRLGHRSGDRLLEEVARRMAATLRSSDTASRVGGDEFVILMAELDEPAGAAGAARRLLAAFEEPFELDGRPARVRARTGVAVFPEHGSTLEVLLARADEALVRAKESGARVAFPDDG